MAKIYAMPNQNEWERKKGEDFDGHFKRQDRMFAKLEKTAASLKKGEYVGGLISTVVGDGQAIYLVHSLKPLKLCHVPYMDGYNAGPIWERGLTVSDVKKMVDRNRNLKSIPPTFSQGRK
jgi:hypothetical protein